MDRVCIAVILLYAGSSLRAQEDQAALRNLVLTRRHAMDNLTVVYSRESTYTSRSNFDKLHITLDSGAEIELVPKNGTETAACCFRFFHGKAMYTSKRFDVDETTIQSFANDRSESLSQRRDRIGGLIDHASSLPMNTVIDVALGLRAFGANEWLNDDVLRNANLKRGTNGDDLTFTWNDGSSAHVWTCGKSVGYALVRYERVRNGHAYKVIENKNFDIVHDVQLPRTIEYTSWHSHDGKTESTILLVSDYDLSNDQNIVDDFHIEWPIGAAVLDVKSGTQLNVASRNKKLDDATIARAIDSRSQRPPVRD